jgi:hypothetical protein
MATVQNLLPNDGDFLTIAWRTIFLKSFVLLKKLVNVYLLLNIITIKSKSYSPILLQTSNTQLISIFFRRIVEQRFKTIFFFTLLGVLV